MKFNKSSEHVITVKQYLMFIIVDIITATTAIVVVTILVRRGGYCYCFNISLLLA